MAQRLYTRNAVLLAKIETTEGVDSGPVAMSNAILVSELSIEPLAGSDVDLAYVRPYFGSSPSMRVEDYVTISMTVDIAGTAAAGTAAPWGPLLRACGFSETLLASALTGSAQAGTTSTVTLASGASSTDNIYNGADIVITSGTGSGQTRTIIAYNGSTKVATVHKAFTTAPGASSGYSIAANAAYIPVSTGFESLTMYYNINGVRHKALGCKGSVSFELAANQRPTMKFSFTGNYGGVLDANEATPSYSSFLTPLAVNTTHTEALVSGKQSDGSATGIQLMSFSLDMANSVKHRQLVGAESVILTDRQPKGSVSIEATTITFNDWFTSIRASSKSPLLIDHGNDPGNSFALLLPNAQLVEPKYTDSDGVVMLDMGVKALPLVGNDEVRVVVK